MTTPLDLDQSLRVVRERVDRLTTQFEVLVRGHQQIVERHDAEARLCNFDKCGCWCCGISRAALRIVDGEAE